MARGLTVEEMVAPWRRTMPRCPRSSDAGSRWVLGDPPSREMCRRRSLVLGWRSKAEKWKLNKMWLKHA
jgi:hypothetical protein